MIDDTGNQQRCRGVERTDFSRPFHRMCFARRCSKGADAWHIEADGKDKSEPFRFRKISRQNRRDIGRAACCFGSESGADEIPARSIEGVQYAEQGFFGDRGGAEGHKSLPF